MFLWQVGNQPVNCPPIPRCDTKCLTAPIIREVVVRSVSEQRPKGKGGLLYLMLHATEPLSCDLPASPP